MGSSKGNASQKGNRSLPVKEIPTIKLQLMLYCVNLELHWHLKKSFTTKALEFCDNLYLSSHSIQNFVYNFINIEVYEKPVKSLTVSAVKFWVYEENRIVKKVGNVFILANMQPDDVIGLLGSM